MNIINSKVRNPKYTHANNQYFFDVLNFIFAVAVFIICAVATVLLSYKFCDGGNVFFSSLGIFSNKTFAENENAIKFIIIDPGHGGEDGGAVSSSGISEKNINLNISKYLYDFLKISNVTPILTRDDDRLLYKDGQENKKKYYDLRNRVDIANSYDNAMFISIHQNKFAISNYSGFQMYFSKNNPESEKIASLIQNNVKKMLQPSNKRLIKKADKKILVLDSLNMPAVLAECGFLSNENEAWLLTQEDYQKKIAYTIYISLIDYIDNKNKDVK